MKILYIHQYFRTPNEPGGTRSYWVAKKMLDRGHDVIMITSTNQYRTESGICNIDGIQVIYVKNEYSNYFSKFKKVCSFFKFIYKSIIISSKLPSVDIVYATSTPLTVGCIALWLRFIRGWKYIFEVRDLWPEFPVQIGAVRNKSLVKLLYSLERKIYNKAEFIVTLSPDMEKGVLKQGISSEKTSVIPNMSKPDDFYPRIKNEEIAQQYNIDLKKISVVHFGSMGVANGLEFIIDTAKELLCRGEIGISFIFLGDGATKPKLEAQAKIYGLTNVSFLGSFDMKTTSEIVNCCDISITSFKNIPILYTNSPNKLFDSLSAGKAIVVNSAGWTKELVEKYNCGFYVDPDSPIDFADKLIVLKSNQDKLDVWGNNARKLSLEVFDKDILASKVVDIVEQYGKTI